MLHRLKAASLMRGMLSLQLPEKLDPFPLPGGRPGWGLDMPGKTARHTGHRIHPRTKSNSRRLRRSLTAAEQRLWSILRLRQINGYKFRRQHPYGPYILDFVCLEEKLAIEVDGGQHADAEAQDRMRTTWLEQHGFRVLRFWNNEVLGDIEAVAAVILKALASPNT